MFWNWIRAWFSQRERIAELERELDAAYEDNARLHGRVDRLVAHEQPLRLRANRSRFEVRRLNHALRLRSLLVETLQHETRFLRAELKRNPTVIPLRVEPENDAEEADPIYTNVSQA